MPFTELQRTQSPLSLYAATKGATELMGHSYSHLFDIPVTFFSFFTVPALLSADILHFITASGYIQPLVPEHRTRYTSTSRFSQRHDQPAVIHLSRSRACSDNRGYL